MNQVNIRNFAIIAHIDHGKSTLADRLLEKTGTIPLREMRSQVLDTMELEREKGITIKLTAVRLKVRPFRQLADGEVGPFPSVQAGKLSPGPYILNLIDTPGHVDFSYEVSRSLAACEGAVLVVDATQGIQAQTLANIYKALEQDLVIIPVINKIDLATADPEGVVQELEEQLGFKREEVLLVSAKEGVGIEEVLEAVVERIPPPSGDPEAPFRALVFDSLYDAHKGVVALVRVVDGVLKMGAAVEFLGSGSAADAAEVGILSPGFTPTGRLSAGEVGYLATGLKEIQEVRVGDTITTAGSRVAPLPGCPPATPARQALLGLRGGRGQSAKPMVFAGFYPASADDFGQLKAALDRLHLSDASFSYQIESAEGLGRGFRCGFLGMLHSEIIKERLGREFGLEIIVTAPSVQYRVELKGDAELVEVSSPQDLPEQYRRILEPWVKAEILVPETYLGKVMQFCEDHRGEVRPFGPRGRTKRLRLQYELPLSELLWGFYDGLKSVSSGFASFDYEPLDYREVDAVKLSILVHGEPVEPLAQIVLREKAARVGRKVVARLKESLPRQQFKVALQAAIGGKIIARENLPALRKDVTAKLYGGDRTRKDKLLQKQKKGKAKLAQSARIHIPPETFFKVMSS